MVVGVKQSQNMPGITEEGHEYLSEDSRNCVCAKVLTCSCKIIAFVTVTIAALCRATTDADLLLLRLTSDQQFRGLKHVDERRNDGRKLWYLAH
jgi:hypothetical protein